MSTVFNVGIIGYGLSAKIFQIPYLKATPQFAVRAIVTCSKAKEAREHNPEATVYESVTELLQDGGVNVIIVATPPDTHFDLARQALKAGKHVVVEKPFAPTVSECDSLIRLAAERNRILTVYQNRRWDADFATLRNLLAENALGPVLEFESHFDRYTDPDTPAAKSGKPGTGVLYDLGTHLIDQALVLFGLPERVTGFLSEIDDACTVLLHYRSGPLVTVKASAASAETEQLRFWVRGRTGSFKKHHLDVQEPQLASGMAVNHVDFGRDPPDHSGVVTRWNGTRLKKSTRPNDAPETYAGFYGALAQALDGRGELPVWPDEARDVVKIVELAIASSKRGSTLDLS